VGKDKERLVKTRVNQEVFRDIVLANYESKCAITGIDIEPLLVASHIIPWSQNEHERLNPENGICLSALFDRAFDKGLIGISNKYDVIVSLELKKYSNLSYFDKYFGHLHGSSIILPKKYMPNREFLQYHMDTIFQG
jgi:putative restriction endonuclease